MADNDLKIWHNHSDFQKEIWIISTFSFTCWFLKSGSNFVVFVMYKYHQTIIHDALFKTLNRHNA